MAGKIIDPEEYENDSVETSDIQEDEFSHASDNTQNTNNESDTAPEIPDKYRGKSMEEIVRMHQEAEKLLGRQSQEVGELRKAFDSFVIQQAQKNVPQDASHDADDDDDTDFFVKPRDAVRRELENHPAIKEAQAISQEYKKANSLQQLQRMHPDMADILRDNAFQQWIGKSKYRQNLFVQADQNYDYEAASELFSTWKEVKGVVNQTKQVEKQAQKQEIKKAATGSARSNPDGQQTRKIYRRADIRKLMQTDPDRYMELSEDILKAYAEGRVR